MRRGLQLLVALLGFLLVTRVTAESRNDISDRDVLATGATSPGDTQQDRSSTIASTASCPPIFRGESQPWQGRYYGPRLRKPPDPDGELGFDIAIEQADGHALDAFYQGLARAARGAGEARLVFYGASHVASDILTAVLREELQRRFGERGHGFVMPVPPWRHYRHDAIVIDADAKRWERRRVRASTEKPDFFGFAGTYVESAETDAYGSAAFAPDFRLPEKKSVLFETYFLKQPKGGHFVMLVDGQEVAEVDTADKRYAAGYVRHRAPPGSRRVEVRLRGDGPVRLFGTSLELDAPGVVVDVVGINGARARYQLLWDDALYREHLQRRPPDLLVLAYGTNESGDRQPLRDYEAQLRQVVRRARSAAPESSCLLIGPSDRPIRQRRRTYRRRQRTEDINRVQHRVAMDYGCGYFDLFAFMGGHLSMLDWTQSKPRMAAPDHVHLTFRGYRRLGRVLTDALLEGYDGPERGR